MKVITVVIFVVLGFAGVNAAVIDTIIFVGNVKTKDNYLQRVVSRISNTEYLPQSDTAVFKALNRTRLFSEITVVPSQNPEGNVSIFVVLKERRNFSMIDVGAGLNDTEFGEESGTWAWMRLGVQYNNLFGINQRLSLIGQIGRDRFIGTNWFIPFGASPYFFDVGALVGRRPSLVWHWEIAPFFDTHLGFGRHIGENQLVFMQTSPRFRKYNNLERQQFYEWRITDSDDFWEIYQKLYYRFSVSDDNYPPLFASFAGVGLSTNKIMAHENLEHWEISSDLKQNVPISQKARHSFFFRMRPTITFSGERNKYSGLLTGGQDFVRGWGNDILGSRDSIIYNNLLLGTAEYQFHIVTLPAMRFGWLSWYDKSMSKFAPQLVGALFLDGGRLFREIENPQNATVSAASAGISIRLIQPGMRLGAELDLAWQIAGDEKYLNKNRNAPVIHLGLIAHF